MKGLTVRASRMIAIDYEKCCWKDGKCVSCGCDRACVGCAEACSVGALERQKLVVFHPDKCVDCGACIDACKYHAIRSAS